MAELPTGNRKRETGNGKRRRIFRLPGQKPLLILSGPQTDQKDDSMKGGFRERAARFSGRGMVIVSFAVLLFPSLPSVLCIAPGSHVAIEIMNAPCCSRSAVSSPYVNPADGGIAPAGDCRNCTDLLIMPNGRGVRLDSFSSAAPGQSVPAAQQNSLSPDDSYSVHRLNLKSAMIFSALPFLSLRC